MSSWGWVRAWGPWSPSTPPKTLGHTGQVLPLFETQFPPCEMAGKELPVTGFSSQGGFCLAPVVFYFKLSQQSNVFLESNSNFSLLLETQELGPNWSGLERLLRRTLGSPGHRSPPSRGRPAGPKGPLAPCSRQGLQDTTGLSRCHLNNHFHGFGSTFRAS